MIQPKTEHSRAAAPGKDMNCSFPHRIRHIQRNFLPGEEGRNNPTPLILSENNRCVHFQNLTPDLHNVSSAIHNNEKDPARWSPLCRKPFQFYLHTYLRASVLPPLLVFLRLRLRLWQCGNEGTAKKHD